MSLGFLEYVKKNLGSLINLDTETVDHDSNGCCLYADATRRSGKTVKVLPLIMGQKKHPVIHKLHGRKILTPGMEKEALFNYLVFDHGIDIGNTAGLSRKDWNIVIEALKVFSTCKRFLQNDMSPNKWMDSQGLPHFPPDMLAWFTGLYKESILEVVSRPQNLVKIGKSKHYNSCMGTSYPEKTMAMLEFAFHPTTFCFIMRDNAGHVKCRYYFMVAPDSDANITYMNYGHAVYGSGVDKNAMQKQAMKLFPGIYWKTPFDASVDNNFRTIRSYGSYGVHLNKELVKSNKNLTLLEPKINENVK